MAKVLGTADEIQLRLDELARFEDALEASLGEFEHQLRRTNDALERQSGRNPELERDLKRLQTNRRLALRDLKKTTGERHTLTHRLAALIARSESESP